MSIKKQTIKGLVLIILIAVGVYGISLHQRFKARSEFAKRIMLSLGQDPSTETIEDLQKAIALYEKRIERHVKDAGKTGTYWKILAVRLAERGLHGEALEALEHAIYYSPEDPTLQYAIGVSAGIIAKSIHIFPGRESPEREQYFAFAEEAYLRAIELDGRYLRPKFGLGVLYAFELDRPSDAIPYLEQCLEISRNDVDTMFVLARAYYMMERYQAALDLYDRIITLSKDQQKRIDAQNNRQIVMEKMYG
jgi:tetratricopeptide (TPR) repeat protein